MIEADLGSADHEDPEALAHEAVAAMPDAPDAIKAGVLAAGRKHAEILRMLSSENEGQEQKEA